MPELPDVESYRQYLDATALHKAIHSTEVLDERILDHISRKKLQQTLENNRFIATLRHGKHLFSHLDSGPFLVLHFGMTGYLRYFKERTNMPDHTRLLITFDTQYHLAFVCMRLLGHVGISDSIKNVVSRNDLGPDAESITAETLYRAAENSRAAIKSLLMNQSVIAGIGNVYSDEILFQAGIHPAVKAGSLDRGSIDRIVGCMETVVETAVQNNAEIDSYPEYFLLPHRGKDGECPRCGGQLKQKKISGRTAWFCQTCQS